MVESEREMLRRDENQDDPTAAAPREFTSLQRTYEDSVPPSPDDWTDEDPYADV